MILLITILASLSILFFAINAAEASLSDLDNIKPSRPINPEGESPTQDEAESDVVNTKTYPTEEEYCKINILDENPTREGYTLKLGTNNDDELYGTYNRDLILGLDGNDIIYGLEGGDIICGGKGNDQSNGDPSSYGYSPDKIPKSKNGELPTRSGDLIFGQEGNDIIYGGAGNDLIQGGIGDDSLWGHYGVSHGDVYNDGNDLIDGGPGDDSCYDHQSKRFLNCEFTSDAFIK